MIKSLSFCIILLILLLINCSTTKQNNDVDNIFSNSVIELKKESVIDNKKDSKLNTLENTNCRSIATCMRLIKETEAKLIKNEIAMYGIWQFGQLESEKLYYLIKDESSDAGNQEQRIVVFDTNQKIVFESSANSYDGIEIIDLLRQKSKQMLIKRINYGGSGNFFDILQFKDGKVKSITDEDDTLYSGEVIISPQYQEKDYFHKPFQVFLTENISDESAKTNILRYIKGKYVSVGKINLFDINVFIDQKIVMEKP